MKKQVLKLNNGVKVAFSGDVQKQKEIKATLAKSKVLNGDKSGS